MLEKFKELSKLVNEIMPKDMMNNIDALEMALENMDMDSIQDALSQLSEDMEKVEKDLDRYLEIFKRFQAEQKLDEIQNRLQNLIEQQSALDNEIDEVDENPNSIDRLAQEEQRNLDEFKDIQSLVEDASEMIEEFNKNTANELSELSESELSENIMQNLSNIVQSLSNRNNQDAEAQSKESLSNMSMMMQQMVNIKQGFNQDSVNEMVDKFQNLLLDGI